jgi:hypothetical protein
MAIWLALKTSAIRPSAAIIPDCAGCPAVALAGGASASVRALAAINAFQIFIAHPFVPNVDQEMLDEGPTRFTDHVAGRESPYPVDSLEPSQSRL